MHHSLTEMCTHLHIFATRCCIVGYGTGASWCMCNIARYCLQLDNGIGRTLVIFWTHSRYPTYRSHVPTGLSLMTSSHANIFRLTGREFPAQRPVTRSFDVFFDLCLNKRLSKQSWDWWFETLSRPLWRHYNVVSLCVLESTDGVIMWLRQNIQLHVTRKVCDNYLQSWFQSLGNISLWYTFFSVWLLCLYSVRVIIAVLRSHAIRRLYWHSLAKYLLRKYTQF